MVQLLTDAGANKDIQNEVSMLTSISNMILTFALCKDGDTGLTIASIKGHNKVVELLLIAGAKTDLKRKVFGNVVVKYCC